MYGQLGDGTTTDRPTPVDVTGLTSGVESLTAFANQTCAVMSSGGAKCWGRNQLGQLGDGRTTDSSVPVDVVGLSSRVANIAMGYDHACAALAVGTVRCWGDNSLGQLGDGTTAARSMPVEVVGVRTGLSVVAGRSFSCVLEGSGSVSCWGDNPYGQLGDGTIVPRSAPVSVVGLSGGVVNLGAGAHHACAVTSGGGGALWCWGYNAEGALGDGTMTRRTTPVELSISGGVMGMVGGGSHTCVPLATGALSCWGHNIYGQLGDGTTIRRLTAVDVVGLGTLGGTSEVSVASGAGHVCARTTVGLRCWGWNNHGQLGDGTTADRHTPVSVIGL